jgi:hypothetical protein
MLERFFASFLWFNYITYWWYCHVLGVFRANFFIQYFSDIIIKWATLWFTFYSIISMLQLTIIQWTMACIINIHVLILHHSLIRHLVINWFICNCLINRKYIIGIWNHSCFKYLIKNYYSYFWINRLIFQCNQKFKIQNQRQISLARWENKPNNTETAVGTPRSQNNPNQWVDYSKFKRDGCTKLCNHL